MKNKLESVLVGGVDFSADHALKVLKSDEYRLLADYFVFEPRNLKIEVNVSADGSVDLRIDLKAKGFRDVGRTLDDPY